MTYYYVDGNQQGGPAGAQQQQPRTYGTVGSSPSQQFPGQQNGTMPGAQQYRQEQSMPSGSSKKAGSEVPPSYADVIKGDHKVQTHE